MSETPKTTTTTLVRVTLILRQEQREADLKWRVTLDGESRLIANDLVIFWAEDFDAAMARFRQEECESIKIEWSRSRTL